MVVLSVVLVDFPLHKGLAALAAIIFPVGIQGRHADLGKAEMVGTVEPTAFGVLIGHHIAVLLLGCGPGVVVQLRLAVADDGEIAHQAQSE